MTNSYYNKTVDLVPNTLARTAQIENELELIEDGFDGLDTKAQDLEQQIGALQVSSPTTFGDAVETWRYLIAGGTADALTATPSPAPGGADALVAGQRWLIKATATNTGAATLNVGSTDGAVAINKQTVSGLTALEGGEIVSGQAYWFVFDGAVFQLIPVIIADAANPYARPNRLFIECGMSSTTSVFLVARAITVRNASGALRLLQNVVVTMDIATLGANGRDVGALAAAHYTVHVIYNGSTVAGILKQSNTPSGSATSSVTDKLVDSSATFITDDVNVGDAIVNADQRSLVFVTSVDSETQLGVSQDEFLVGNGYTISRRKPVLPSGYTFWSEPIGVASSNGASVTQSIQHDNTVWFRSPQTIASGLTSTSFTGQDLNAVVPITTGMVTDVLYGGVSSSGSPQIALSNDQTNTHNALVLTATDSGTGGFNQNHAVTGANSNFLSVDRYRSNYARIYYKLNSATSSTLTCRAYKIAL